VNADIEAKQVELYEAPDGSFPYETWFDGLKDRATKHRIEGRITRLRKTGNFGRFTAVGEGVIELQLDFGAGYRIYAGQLGAKVVLLLCGGDKSTQVRDILAAKERWAEHLQSRPQKERVVSHATN